MSYNGSGTFNINSAGQPVVTGTVISSTAFNALTADLGTGLSTALTKDGQTVATARIPFAAGINSSLVTDATNTTTGSIITAGGVGIAKAVFVGTTLNVAGASTLAGITGSFNGTVGATTPAAGAFTTVSASGAVSPANYINILGAQNGNSAKLAFTRTDRSWSITNETNLRFYTQATDTVSPSTQIAELSSTGLAVTGAGTFTPSGIANGVRIGQWSDSTSYGMVSFNGVYTVAGFVGIGGDAAGGALYYNATGGGINTHAFRISGTDKATISSTGLAVTGTISATGTITSSGATGGLSGLSTAASDENTVVLTLSKFSTTNTTAQVFARFLVNNNATGSGSITANGASAAAFGTFSDSRLKDNITNLPPQLANILALRPVEFDYKDGSGHQLGFIAQEVQEIYPDLVGVGEGGMLTLTDMNKNDARLIKAIQELKAIIDTQATRITALEAK